MTSKSRKASDKKMVINGYDYSEDLEKLRSELRTEYDRRFEEVFEDCILSIKKISEIKDAEPEKVRLNIT